VFTSCLGIDLPNGVDLFGGEPVLIAPDRCDFAGAIDNQLLKADIAMQRYSIRSLFDGQQRQSRVGEWF
jgi:hypothetical protein